MTDTSKHDDPKSASAQEKKEGRIKKIQKEFVTFLWDYSVMGLAIGVIIGGAVNTFVQSLVSGVITPLIQLVIPSNTFRNFVFNYHGVIFALGPLLGSFLNLIIEALLIFLTIKYVLFRGGKIEREKISRD
jgi:large conductance mechanosensitive channel